MSLRMVALVAVALLAGCGPVTAATNATAPAGEAAGEAAGVGPGPPVVASRRPDAGPPAGADAPTWAVRVDTVDGRPALVDQEGHTLYAFTRDTAADSACLNQCALTWPPFVGYARAGGGLRQRDFATIARSDGHSQVTYHGHPLYYFAGDRQPGDANGEGIAGAWFLIAADGTPAR